jgi:NADPH:quinone reductase
MRAMTIPRFGEAEVLCLADMPEPEPGPGEVAIEVDYAGVNYAEVLFRRGVVDVNLPFIPGIEVSGHVRAIGEGVSELAIGEAVAALTIVNGGGYAEVVVVDARLVVSLAGLTGAELAIFAGVPSNTTTAFMVFEDVARMRDGEIVLVHAAAGGVGSQLGQVAKLLGAGRVVGAVGSAAKVEAAKMFGYDDVVLRDDVAKTTDELTRSAGYDVIVDMVGGPTRRVGLDALAPGGRLIVMGNASDAEDVHFAANELWFSGKGVLGFNLAALGQLRPDVVRRALRRGVEAVRDGSIRVELSGRVPLEQVVSAHRRIESGSSTGKLVLER